MVSSEVDKLLATLCLLTCQEYKLLANPNWNPVGKGVWAIEFADCLKGPEKTEGGVQAESLRHINGTESKSGKSQGETHSF